MNTGDEVLEKPTREPLTIPGKRTLPRGPDLVLFMTRALHQEGILTQVGLKAMEGYLTGGQEAPIPVSFREAFVIASQRWTPEKPEYNNPKDTEPFLRAIWFAIKHVVTPPADGDIKTVNMLKEALEKWDQAHPRASGQLEEPPDPSQVFRLSGETERVKPKNYSTTAATPARGIIQMVIKKLQKAKQEEDVMSGDSEDMELSYSQRAVLLGPFVETIDSY